MLWRLGDPAEARLTALLAALLPQTPPLAETGAGVEAGAGACRTNIDNQRPFILLFTLCCLHDKTFFCVKIYMHG